MPTAISTNATLKGVHLTRTYGDGAKRRGARGGGSEARRRADDMLDKLGLTPNRHKKPAQLSGGEKQRVAIGRALVKDPTFVFADEPTSALDWENGQKVIELLRDAAHERGASILVVSHDHRIL